MSRKVPNCLNNVFSIIEYPGGISVAEQGKYLKEVMGMIKTSHIPMLLQRFISETKYFGERPGNKKAQLSD